MLKTSTDLVVPSGIKNADPIIIDLKNIKSAESRIEEIGSLSIAKAPELLSTFNRTYAELHEKIVLLMREQNKAERAANSIRAIILLDKAKSILEQKGLSSNRSPIGSEDLRSAILDQDSEYQDALDRVQQIVCVLELLRGKMRAIAMAYSSVKKIIESHRTYTNPNLSVGNELEASANPIDLNEEKFDISWRK